jgi:replicative DNA helicase
MRGPDFYREAHQKIFAAMVDMYQKGIPVDLITLSEFLLSRNQMEAVGGAAYLASLADAIPSAVNIEVYARIVRDKATLRRLISLSAEIASKSYRYSGDVEDILDQAEKSIFEITEDKITPHVYPLSEVIKDSFRTIEELYDRKERVSGVPTGFINLDQYTSGLQPSDLIIVAGRPSMGKTAFALDMARNAATQAEIPVLIFSLEMSRQQLATRMLCSEARVDAHRLRSGYIGERDWPRLTSAAGVLSEAPIFIDDSAAMSVLQMRAKARRLKADRGLGLVVVDYLQLMSGRAGADRREQEISEISRSLKALAKELHLPVIALSQLNRKVEDRTDKRPVMADLRESGAIEQDADVILFIYRDEMYDENSKHKGIAEIIIGKQRNGPTGSRKLAFIKEFTRFENLEWRGGPA